jgi:hypothetical protein
MGMDEVVDYLRDPDQVTFYGLANILPATPIRWALENVEAADRHLHSGLARWYMRPLAASLAPIDVITGPLRTKRPYYYHCMLFTSADGPSALRPALRLLPERCPPQVPEP